MPRIGSMGLDSLAQEDSKQGGRHFVTSVCMIAFAGNLEVNIEDRRLP